MTINIFVLKGDLNGKIVVVRFFFCRVYNSVLIAFSLTVKAATLIFISGRGSAILSAKGNQVLFIIW